MTNKVKSFGLLLPWVGLLHSSALLMIRMLKKGEGVSPEGASPLAMNLTTSDSTVMVVMMIDATIGKKCKECSTPHSEPVSWLVTWEGGKYPPDRPPIAIARTAFEAHSQIKDAPAFGSCVVRRLT